MCKVILTIGLACTLVVTADGQRQGRGQRGQQNRGGPGRGFGQMPESKLMVALDADKDGKISAKEIEKAVEALQTIDADKNGKLSSEEIGWPPTGGTRIQGSFGGFGGFFGGSQQQGRPRRPDPDATSPTSDG
ncbi:MAG: hypothetical protein MPJ50_02105 [Pirellulales bacterium]|nr:hypothetical protein [Pirellulales bacterium]